MAFMELETEHGAFLLIETTYGSEIIPPETVSLPLTEGETQTSPDAIDDILRSLADLDTDAEGLRDSCWENSENAGPLSDWFKERGRDTEAKEVERWEKWQDALSSLRQYTNGQIESIEVRECWGSRYSAPGYLDCTDWILSETEEEAVSECKAIYGEEEGESESEDGE